VIRRIEEALERRVKRSRLDHTFGVVSMARELARIHGADETKAELAAYLHDYCKYDDDQTLLQSLEAEGLGGDAIITSQPKLGHGYAAAHVARHEFGIEDEEILDAIRYHTFGRQGMGKLEKIIYIADAIEPLRDYLHVDRLRDLAKRDLDEALLFSVSQTIKYVVDKGQAIHPNSMAMYNDLIINIEKEEREIV
jgi:predicted HD superfamily hydrolase involved in NAD metabolism